MVKPKSKTIKSGDKSSRSRGFSLMRSFRSLRSKRTVKKPAENRVKAEPPMSNSVYFDLKKSEKNKSKKRQSRMGSIEPAPMTPSDEKTVNPLSQKNKVSNDYENVNTARPLILDDKLEESSRSKKKNKSKRQKLIQKNYPKRKQKNLGSEFETVAGPLSPVNAEPRGVEDKMRWKIDVEGVDLNGDQRMSEVLEKLGNLRKKFKTKKCKVLKANEKIQKDGGGDDEPTEDEIVMGAKLLQLVKMDQLINREFDPVDQDILRKYCRSGDMEEKAEELIERITMIILVGVSSKNNYIRQVSIPGQMRMFAVDENKSKLPVMALLLVRCDLLYYSWAKPSKNEEELDNSWANMAIRKVPMPVVVSAYYPAARQGALPKK